MKSNASRFALTILSTAVGLALAAPAALARITGGEGLYGPADDKVVTNDGFAIIILIPLLLVILSIFQARAHKREVAAHEAVSNRADLAEWQGGW
jgi:hypothetical protein